MTALIAEAEMVLSDKFSTSRFWEEIRQCNEKVEEKDKAGALSLPQPSLQSLPKP
jgi:hypothetical protein